MHGMENFDLYKDFLNSLFDTISPFIDELIDSISGPIREEEKRHLRKVINETIQLDGYRKGNIHNAPKNILRNKISSALENHPRLVDASLKVLACSRQPLIDSIKPLIRKKVRKEKLAGRKEIEVIESISTEIDSLVEEITNFDATDSKPEDIRLAIWISLINVLQEDDSGQEGLELWDDIIEQIENIPAEDARWKVFDQFVQRIHEIEQKKKIELENASLRKNLDTLLSENSNLLVQWANYFEISGVQDWSNDKIPASQETYQKVYQQLNELIDQLAEYAELEQQKPQTISQRQEHTKALEALGQRIIHLFSELQIIYAREDTPAYIPIGSTEALGLDSSGESLTISETPPPQEPPESENGQSIKPPSVVLPEDPFRANKQLIFNFIENRDFAKAYWYAWAWEKLDNEPIMPSSLIAAVQGTLWLLGMYPDYPSDYLEILREFVKPDQITINEKDYPQTVLGLTVGIILNLMPQKQGWEGWIELPNHVRSEAFIQLLEEVKKAHRQGITLDPIIISTISREGGIEDEIQSLATEVQRWLDRALVRKAAFFRASQVWQALLHSKNGELSLFLSKVAKNRTEEVDQILNELKNWRDHAWLDKLIQNTDRQLSERKHRRPIDGEPREQLIGWIQDVCDLVEKWAKVVKQSQFISAKQQNWLYERTRELCQKLSELIPQTISDIDAQNVGERYYQLTSRNLLAVFLDALLDIIRRGKVQSGKLTNPPLLTRENEIYKYDLEHNLAISLYYYPEIKLNSEGLPLPEKDNCELILSVLEQHPSREAEQAVEAWINKHEYRFTTYLTEHCQDSGLWQTRVVEAYNDDLTRLPGKIERLDAELQQALIDGLIADNEAAHFSNQLEQLRKKLKTKENNGQQFIPVNQLFHQLEEIQQDLASKRQKRLSSLANRWEQIKPQLKEFLDEADVTHTTLVIEKAIQTGEIRVLDEYLFALEQREPIKISQEKDKDKEILLEFIDEIPNIISILKEPYHQDRLYQLFRHPTESPSIKGYTLPPNFPTPRRKEGDEAITAWLRLKKSLPFENHENINHNLSILMRFLGFSLSGHNPISIKSNSSWPSNFAHWRVSGSLADPLVAQFGSERKGFYDVIGVWQRPGFDVISSELERIIQNYTNQPIILLFFGWLPLNLRRDLFYFARKDHIPMLVIDEVLMLFLARRLDSRSRAMFICTLPFAAINPYFPAAAGAAPPEIFKGREDALKNVLDFYGPCIVYGGRQLGKSTLLHMARRRFHQPDQRQYVLYADIRNIGSDATGKPHNEEFAHTLKNGLNEIAFPGNIRSNDLRSIIEEIKTALIKNDLRLLLLLDEADNFLNADAKYNFEVIQYLKTLMDSSERRFKVVLAGLHNVQRFQRISNQPLAHLGTPIEIGPLEPKAAYDLLVEPLTQIGYRFKDANGEEDRTLPLHILSYTNYHPGLIQYFAHALVEYLREKYLSTQNLPPLAITRADVENVYRKREVREAIRDRFKWTLNLDPRYEVIVLSLIVEQLDDQNGFDRLYSSREIFEAVKYWKPNTIKSDTIDEEGSLTGFLDELCGLGVLTRSEEGSKYRLRSPNLVNLLGTRDEILDYLHSIEDISPETRIQVVHAPLPDSNAFSPFTLANEQQLYTKRTSGVVLIFGSAAAGLYDIQSAVQRTLPSNGKLIQLSIASQSGNALRQQLEDFRKEYQRSSYLIALREMAAESSQLLEQVESAIDLCRRYRSSDPKLRVLFVFDPLATWQWYQIPADQRHSIEDKVDVVLSLDLWTKQAIQYSVESRWGDIFHGDSLFKKIHFITNGWHSLLSDLFEMHFDPKNPENSIEHYRQKLEENAEVKRKFIDNLALERFPQNVVNLLIKEKIKEIPDNELIELLQIEFNVDRSLLEATLGYLRRLRVLTPSNALDPVVSRCWLND